VILLMNCAGRTRFHPNARKISACLAPRSWATFEEKLQYGQFPTRNSRCQGICDQSQKKMLRQCDVNYVYAGTNVPTMSFFAVDYRSSLRPTSER
jgi:hypothetical protein